MGTPVLRMRECCEGLMKPAQYDDSQSLCGRREGARAFERTLGGQWQLGIGQHPVQSQATHSPRLCMVVRNPGTVNSIFLIAIQRMAQVLKMLHSAPHLLAKWACPVGL